MFPLSYLILCVISQAFARENRPENPANFELVEETLVLNDKDENTHNEKYFRVLDRDESVHKSWQAWSGKENREFRFYVARRGSTQQDFSINV